MCQTMDVIDLDSSGGYIGKQTLVDTGAYLSDCIWSLKVSSGQKISFMFYSFLYGITTKYKKISGMLDFIYLDLCPMTLMLALI